MKEIELPKYFIIKQCNDPLWDDYIEWLNKTYNKNYLGDSKDAYYGYDGNEFSGGTSNWLNKSRFENDPFLISLDYWNKCINNIKNKSQMTQKYMK